MSEIIDNQKRRLQQLKTYSFRVLEGERGAGLYQEFKEIIKEVTPKDIIAIVDELVNTGKDITNIKRTVNKLLNTFYSATKDQGAADPPKGHLLHLLMDENQKMNQLLNELKVSIKNIFQSANPLAELIHSKEILINQFVTLQDYEKHYQIKENVIFPYFEKAFRDHRCVSIMWSMHDDARSGLNKLIRNLESMEPNINEFNFEIGKYFFAVKPVIFREDFILFPECLKVIPDEDWNEMLKQSLEVGFAFLSNDQLQSLKKEVSVMSLSNSIQEVSDDINLETGILKVDQIIDLFNHLPVDITYVDENDEVRYFSNPKDRYFTRSKAIIGRKVQNCHPPESIDIVNKIVESFKTGEKDEELFWIQMKEKFILIRYYAIRNDKGEYKGVLEVSEDITKIRKLEGEKRLLDN